MIQFIRLPTVLIVVDLQKGFVTSTSKHVVKPITAIQHGFDHVVFTKFYNPDPSPFRSILHYHKLAPHSEETELVLTPRSDALIVDRARYSCVTEKLRRYLADLGTRDVYICGIATEACVMGTALELFEHNIRPWVIKDLCASDQDRRYHEMAMELIAKLIGEHQIIDSSEMRERLSSTDRPETALPAAP